MSGDLAREDEWYPRECMFCTQEAALACTDAECRERRLGEPYDSPTASGMEDQ